MLRGDKESYVIAENVEPSKTQIELLSVNDFTARTARYVRVTLTGGENQIVPNEIIIFGE